MAAAVRGTAPAVPRPGTAASAPRRWWGLAVIGLAQLLVVLDATVVNIALPSAQRDLGMSDTDRQWVVTAYTLAFGGLLLLGGRIADLAGRRRLLLVGLAGFALASAWGGLAPDAGSLFAARALQGAFAAFLAPAALSLLTTLFPEPAERARAFGVYGALSGGGAAAGLLAGGVLTEYLDWRWCLFVNVPLAALALAGCALLPRDHRARGARLDLPGALLGCGGLLALGYAFAEAEGGWTRPPVPLLLPAGLLLLLAFAAVERRGTHPLLPPRVLADRRRGGAFLAVGLPQVGLFGLFLFLTYYLQEVLGLSPVVTGLAFLPLSAAMGVGATVVAGRALRRGVPARTLVVSALTVAAAGMALLTGLGPDTAHVYPTRLLPAQLLIGLGIGCTMMPAMITASEGVAPGDAGVTAAIVNSAQQVGGSLGLALLSTVSTTSAQTYLAQHGGPGPGEAAATVHGYTAAITASTLVLLLTAVLAWVLLRPETEASTARRPSPGAPPAL